MPEAEKEVERANKRNIIRNRWLDIFIKEAKDNGWRVCDPYPNRSKDSEEFKVCLTRLSEEEWTTLEPALPKIDMIQDAEQDFVF